MFTKRDILKIIIPMIIQNVLSIAVSTADSMMVASAGEEAVSGVSLVGSVDALLVLLFSSLVTGGAITVSHALGSGDKKYTRDCAKQLLYISTSIAVVVAAIAVIFRAPILNSLYSDADIGVRTSGIKYMGIIALSFPLLAITESGTALLRVMGNTTTSMYLSFGTNIINVIGNAVFIFGFNMGVRGAALSTVISRFVYAIVITAILHNKQHDVYYEKLYAYKPDIEVIKKILRIGVPHGVENSMFQFGRLVTQVLISGMGTSAIAANSVSNTLANYFYVTSNAIQNASITVVGRCYGAKDFVQAKKYASMLLRWAYICMWIVSILLVACVNPIANIYNLSEKATHLMISITILHAVGVSTVRPLAFSLPSIFKSAGNVKLTMIVSTISMWVVRVGAAYVFSLDTVTVKLFNISFPGLGLGIYGIWIAMLADWVVRAIFYTPYFIKNKWLKQ